MVVDKDVCDLPRETKVDVAKCHACHPKCRGVGAQTAPKRATRASPVPQVPRLPRKTKVDVNQGHACHAKVDVAKCHACHAKYRGVTGD
jgi:hypothetical protein